jgi:hypothetical protein
MSQPAPIPAKVVKPRDTMGSRVMMRIMASWREGYAVRVATVEDVVATEPRIDEARE